VSVLNIVRLRREGFSNRSRLLVVTHLSECHLYRFCLSPQLKRKFAIRSLFGPAESSRVLLRRASDALGTADYAKF